MAGPAMSDWAAHLRAIARPVALQPPPAAGSIGVPFASVAAGVVPGPPPVPLPGRDAGLWWVLAGAEADVERMVGHAVGPLWPQDTGQGIEAWTEAELCGLHALWWLARRRHLREWEARVAAAREWHLENTQPDHATCRPWAIHVFLLGSSAESRHYAELLLHNAMAPGGRPDLLSAWIMLHAASALEAL